MRTTYLILCMLLAFSALAGCHKPTRIATLPMPNPAQVVAAEQPAILEPPLPATSTPVAAQELSLDLLPGQLPPPKSSPQTSTRRTKTSSPSVPPTTSMAKNSTLPDTEIDRVAKQIDPPRLESLLTSDEQQKLNRGIDLELKHTRATLAQAASRAMGSSQESTFRQIQSFVVQVEELRKTDLVAAKGLSHKALLLAQDLARSLR